MTNALLLLIAGACISSPPPTGPDESPGDSAEDSPQEVATVQIYPAQSVVAPGDTLQFLAVFRTVDGQVLADSVEWSSDDGAIDVKGRFVAPNRKGNYRVVGRGRTDSSEPPADTAEVYVDPDEALEPVEIVLTPDAITMEPGDEQQFVAELRNDDGVTVPGEISWDATGGTVSEGGLFAAGSTAGSFQVVATAAGLSDEATVTIEASSPPAPPSNQAPEADFTYSCDQLACSLDGTVSSDPDGSLVDFAWSLGDGTSSTGASTSHTYASGESYTVELTVTDDGGATDSRSRTIVVESGEPDPEPEFDVEIHPGQSIQAAVDANPVGTVFLLRAGVHAGQQVTPKAEQEFIGESGAILDGQDSREFAFGGYGVPGARVRIMGLEIRNYVPSQLDFGAILCDNCADWIVEDNVIHDIHGVGVRLGSGMTVRNNHIYGNHNLGIGGFSIGDVIIEGNEIEGNGFDGRSGEFAGLKILNARDLVLRDNYVHHNRGRGLWLDTDIFNALLENNVVVDNEMEGIWLEVVCGAIVRDNLAERNGLEFSVGGWPDKAGIQVVNGTDIEIYGNVVRDNLNGIAVLGATGYPTHACVPDVRNVHVHDNQVQMSDGRTGLAENFGDSAIFESKNNRFERNDYTLGSNADYFTWNGESMNESEWMAAGQDTNGTFER